jgi:hypothetical protein
MIYYSKYNNLKTILYTLPICLIILSLFYYWFAIADRSEVFLYYHNMGSRVPDTSPFSFVTASRYWMSGLVTSGFVLLIYFPVNFILFRGFKNYSPPSWKNISLISFPILVAGTFVITMTVNQPTPPFSHALKVTLATLAGLGIVLKTAELAGKKVLNLILYAADGFAIGFIMLTTSGWLSNLNYLPGWRITFILITYGVCLFILVISAIIYVWRKIESSPNLIFITALTIAYPFGTVFHYLVGTDGHFYITNSDNFFTKNIFLQIFVWIVGYLITLFLCRLRKIAIEKSSSTISQN